MKIFNSAHPTGNPWETSLASDLYLDIQPVPHPGVQIKSINLQLREKDVVGMMCYQSLYETFFLGFSS